MTPLFGLIARLILTTLLCAPVPLAGAEPVPPPAAVAPAPARPHLKSELTLSREIVAFGDLVDGLEPAGAALAAFRAPALGETGTIQVARILEAARAQGAIRDPADIDTRGLAQVVVTRAGRRVGSGEIEAAVKAGLTGRFGLDGRGFALILDGATPTLTIEPDATGEMTVQDLSYDPRSRRVGARLVVAGSAVLRLTPRRVAGQLVETAEIVVPLRTIARGEVLAAGDVVLERRSRDLLSGDLVADTQAAIGRVAKRALPAGLPLRTGDLQRQELVARGEVVTLVYEAPGILISLRGRANDAGALGDTIGVTNPQSKRVLQGVVTGQGRVGVTGAGGGGQVASAP